MLHSKAIFTAQRAAVPCMGEALVMVGLLVRHWVKSDPRTRATQVPRQTLWG